MVDSKATLTMRRSFSSNDKVDLSSMDDLESNRKDEPFVPMSVAPSLSSALSPSVCREMFVMIFCCISAIFIGIVACNAIILNMPLSSIDPCKMVDSGVFANQCLSNRTFQEVRSTYSMASEVKWPMAVVQLPDDFQGDYRPSTMNEFQTLADRLISKVVDAPPSPSSRYAIVTVCIGMDICDIAPPNHRAYALKQGYDYLLLTQSIEGVPPKMLKFLLLTWAMNQGYDWILMLDADSLITNEDISLPGLIEKHLPTTSPERDNISLIATRGGNWTKVHALNNGVFLLRNTRWSLRHCYEIFTSRYAFTRFLGRTLVDQPIQTSLLVAQQELEWPPKTEAEVGKHVMVIPKRQLNSFKRDNSYIEKDKLEGGQWVKGDFLAHFASRNKFSLMLDVIDKEKLLGGAPHIKNRHDFPIPLPGVKHDKNIKAGTCWCSEGQINCMPRFHVIGVHKAGSKSLMRYLAGNPGLAFSPHVEDPVRWLTDKSYVTFEKECENRRSSSDKIEPIFIPKGKHNTTHSLMTCSFDDYALLHGKHSTQQNSCHDGDLPIDKLQMPMFDEMVIWEQGPLKIRGTPLPELFHQLQPSGNMLITVRDAIDVVYSAYNHFGIFEEPGIEKGPGHFHQFILELTKTWTEGDCTAANFHTCLPPHLVSGGSWLSRSIYSEHLPLWLEHFGCSQVHLFDVSVDPMQEVKRLYDFLGVPNDEAAANVTRAAYKLQSNGSQGGATDRNNALNKNSYKPMHDQTRAYLESFYQPYNKQLCELMSVYECLDVPLFQKFCETS